MCHEEELIEVLRDLVGATEHSPSNARERAQRLLGRIDDEQESIRRAEDPYGNDFGNRV